jgi:hypothetical protein
MLIFIFIFIFIFLLLPLTLRMLIFFLGNAIFLLAEVVIDDRWKTYALGLPSRVWPWSVLLFLVIPLPIRDLGQERAPVSVERRVCFPEARQGLFCNGSIS